MKTIKFMDDLVPLILSGEKTVTWRLFDDKDLSVGDGLQFINKQTGESFAQARIISVREKKISEIEDADYDGHEKYKSTDEIITSFRKYYGDEVDGSSIIKIVKYELI